MGIGKVSREYLTFNGFRELADYKTQTGTTMLISTAKVASYFTLVIPFFFFIVWGVTSLAALKGRCSKIQKTSNTTQQKCSVQCKKTLEPPATPATPASVFSIKANTPSQN